MTNLEEATSEQLIAEITRRGKNPRCHCQRWQTYLGRYDMDGYTWRCRGCLRAVAKCGCS